MVLIASSVIAALTLVDATQKEPRANDGLATVPSGDAVAASDRSKPVSELREAARDARVEKSPDARTRSAAFRVEIHKKFALSAAFVVLAVVGLVIARSAPNGHPGLLVAASCLVDVVYFVLLTSGETLAEARVVSLAIGVWSANVLLLAVALLVGGRERSRTASPAG